MTAADDPAPADLMAAAVAAQRAGDAERAEALYRRFLDLHGPRPEVLNNLAGLRYQAGDWAAAADLYRRTVEAGARHPAVHANLARALFRAGDAAGAANAFEHALAFDPEDAEVWNDLGNARFETGDHAGAAKAYERAVRHRPGFARAFNNLGNTRRAMGEIADALKAYDTACRLTGDDHADTGELRTNRAHALLLAGRWAKGFEDYAWRWNKPGVPAPFDPGTPKWTGGRLAGKRVLIVAEQGYGDSILGLRFAQVLAGRAAWVGFAGPEPLVRLAGRVAGVGGAFPFDGPLPDHDRHVLAMDLPGLLKARPGAVPGDVPYINVGRREAPAAGALRVGLAWAGNPAQIDDAKRSFGFRALDPVLNVPGVAFRALQVGARAGESASDPRVGTGVDQAGDFLDTAHAVAGLDLVIAVDSAVAHLAGAMGVAVWVPLTKVPDWRYGTAGAASAFFPSMRLYRQETLGDWSVPMARIAEDLGRLAETAS